MLVVVHIVACLCCLALNMHALALCIVHAISLVRLFMLHSMFACLSHIAYLHACVALHFAYPMFHSIVHAMLVLQLCLE